MHISILIQSACDIVLYKLKNWLNQIYNHVTMLLVKENLLNPDMSKFNKLSSRFSYLLFFNVATN